MNLKLFFREISVELVLFFYLCNYHLVEFFNKNLYVQKTCRFNRTLESDLVTKCDDEETGILFASKANPHYHSVSSLICIVYLIVAVCWSDKAGKRRRPLIFLPIMGQIVQMSSGLIHSYFWSWNASYAVISNTIGEMIGGGRDLMVTAAQIYICDTTNLENRTMRLGLLWLVRSVAAPLGKGASGFILRAVGFYYSYMLCVAISVLSLAFAALFTKTTSEEGAKEVPWRKTFSLIPIVDGLRIVFRNNLGDKRIIVVLLSLIQLFSWFAYLGEQSVIYLFLKHKFNWDEETYSVFQAYRYVLCAIGTVFCSVVLSKMMKIHDGVIGSVAAFCDTFAAIGYAVAFQSWHLYVVTLFDVFQGSAMSVCSSFVSKFYKSHEFGRLFAVIYVFGLLIPFSLPLYNVVFQNTLKYFPAAFFIISAVLNISILSCYCVSYYLDTKLRQEKAPQVEQEAMLSIEPSAIMVTDQEEISPKKLWGPLMENITVEPCTLFYLTTYLILQMINTNLYWQKSCRFNITSEPDLNTRCDDEKQGVLLSSKINSDYRFAKLILCILFTILTTCWSDEAGKRRRPLIYLPIIGLTLQSASGMIHTHFWQWSPIVAALSEMSCDVITGGIVLQFLSTQIYICDVSTPESRTMRLGVLLAVRTLCQLLGSGSAGFILRAVGFFYSYLICFVMAIISLVLALIFVRDVSVPVEKKQHFFQLFNLKRGVFDSVGVVFKKSLGKKRIIVGLLLAIYIMVFFTTEGENSMFYLYFRYKFNLDEKEFSLYSVYKKTGIILGTMFCSVVLSKCLKIHDGIIGMFAGFWDTVAVLCYIFAYQNWHLYAIPLFEMFHGTALSVSVSILTKYYDSSEFGRLYSVIGVFGLIVPACYPSYNIIFQKTLDFFPSAFFILSASVDTIIIILYCISYLLCRKMDK